MKEFNNIWDIFYSLRFVIAYAVIFIVAAILLIRFLYKKKAAGIIATAIVLVCLAVSGILCFTPHNILDIDTDEIAKMEISDVTLTDKKAMEEILNDLNSSAYKRTMPSGIGGHEEYSVRAYDKDGKLLFHIGISDKQTIDTGTFWEKRVNGELNLSLYQNIMEETRWEECKNIYTLKMKNTGEDEGGAKYLEIAERSKELFPLLEEKAEVFVIDADNYQDIDGEGTPLYTMNGLSYPEEIDPYGQSISISKNYLKHNPIQTVSGTDIESQIVYDDLTQNILVPEKYHDMENQILEAYRDFFYLQKVTATDYYNQEAGINETLDIMPEDLSIHIIYVKDEQKYFTYRDDCAVLTDNYITDPIVRIYTSNIHCNYAHSYLSQWTYFYSEKDSNEEAYKEILPYLEQCNTSGSIQGVSSVYSPKSLVHR